MAAVSRLDHRILTNSYEQLPSFFDRSALEFQVDHELGGADVIDHWQTVVTPVGRTAAVRAFPARLLHVLAGNGPGVAALSIIRSALAKSQSLLKLPSNDMFTATAILRAMIEVDSSYPTVRSFSAVYWHGGDEAVESALCRAQWFDKIVAWGGDASIKSIIRYAGPGLEIVSFDPKVSISLIGREAFASSSALTAVVELGATDGAVLNQDACVASRYQFIEGTVGDADGYGELLAQALAKDRPLSAGIGRPLAAEVRDHLDVLRSLDPDFCVWGSYDGRGVVVRSETPIDFHPRDKVVNIVPVDRLADAVRFVSVATQTIGVFPSERKQELRDDLIGAGAQRVVPLGWASEVMSGLPHDGMYPLHRFVRWATDEDEHHPTSKDMTGIK
jgi:hypothetical protein